MPKHSTFICSKPSGADEVLTRAPHNERARNLESEVLKYNVVELSQLHGYATPKFSTGVRSEGREIVVHSPLKHAENTNYVGSAREDSYYHVGQMHESE